MCQKILIVDDNYRNIKLLSEILLDEDFEVYSAEDGVGILELVREIKPDAILLDIMMPKIDGFDVCKLLKSNHDVKDIPVIMVTAKTESVDIKEALGLGAFDYIKKPIDEIEVIARVKSALRYKVNQDRLLHLAMKDSLTGVYNHALLIELLNKELLRQKENRSNIAFVMLDVDYFKKVNDIYGHLSGDLILKGLSDLLLESVGPSDIVGRYGGEEFGLVLSDTNSHDAFSLSDRIRKKVEAFDFHIENQNINITVSMGVLLKTPEDSISVNEMIQKADQSLYKAKEGGRNKVELYS